MGVVFFFDDWFHIMFFLMLERKQSWNLGGLQYNS